jgi:histidine triad (HIT) family protein
VSGVSEADCDFCAIARGVRDPSLEVIAEGDHWVAFFPLEPATPGHTLVIPRLHVPDLWSLELQLARDLMDAVIQVGRAVETALQPEGMNLINSSGAVAEQTVYHFHLHIVPRWRDDGFGRIWPTEGGVSEREEADAADRIRHAWNSS